MGNAVSVDRVCDYVKEQIVSKTIFPGNRLVEETLAEAMSTSRTTVRTAIMRLSYEGFVEMVPNYGAFVVKPTLTDMKQAYAVRTVLEIQAIKLAAGRISDAALNRLRANMQAQRALLNSFSMATYVDLNREFHWEIVKSAENPYLEKYMNELLNKMVIHLIFYDPSIDNSKSCISHGRILAALESRDDEAAAAALVEDILIGNNL